MKTPDRIWLVNMGDEVIWHDDPKPTGYEEPQDSVEYVRVGGQTAAELEALRRDAARYRWLRSQSSPATVMLFGVDEGLALDGMDEAIDAAIAQDVEIFEVIAQQEADHDIQ